jgi:signal transduction histidine kinase
VEQDRLAALAALAGPVSHEFNNFLNAVVLQIAVLQQKAPANVRDDLADLRRQGKRMANLVQCWQNYRQGSQPTPYPVDLGTLVREEVEAICRRTQANGVLVGEVGLQMEGSSGPPLDRAAHVRLSLAPNLPSVNVVAGDLRVLVRFLVTNAAAAITELPGLVEVRTESASDQAVLIVADTGPAVAPEMLPRLFDPFEEVREGPNPLELFACESLVRRRLQGRLEAQPGPAGGVAMVVRFPK